MEHARSNVQVGFSAGVIRQREPADAMECRITLCESNLHGPALTLRQAVHLLDPPTAIRYISAPMLTPGRPSEAFFPKHFPSPWFKETA